MQLTYWRTSPRCFLWLLPLWLVSSSRVEAGEPAASASISAVATVAQPVGILTIADKREPDFLLYCPDRGHVICLLSPLVHDRQYDYQIIDSSRCRHRQLLLSGQIVSRVSFAAFQELPADTGPCIMTLVYTEN